MDRILINTRPLDYSFYKFEFELTTIIIKYVKKTQIILIVLILIIYYLEYLE